MQKIMFNDRFGLTDLVLSGQKTQTRRIIKPQDERLDYLRGWNLDWDFAEFGREGETPLRLCPKYYVGEVVAVAQSYKVIYQRHRGVQQEEFMKTLEKEYYSDLCVDVAKNIGWHNKMFVRPDLMPHVIKITNIRVERLQDISDEDCMKEGVLKGEFYNTWDEYYLYYSEGAKTFKTQHHAFTTLIDKINGKGTCDSNPYVWVYDFELVK